MCGGGGVWWWGGGGVRGRRRGRRRRRRRRSNLLTASIPILTTLHPHPPAAQLGHDFYIFKDSEDGSALKVLYRRK